MHGCLAPPPLSDHVELMWYWRGHSAPRSIERVLPMGTFELVIQLGAQRPSGAGISGPHSEAFFIERNAHDALLGVHFRPGGASPFLGMPASDFRNRYVMLEDLRGRTQADALINELLESRSVQDKFRVLSRWLLQLAGDRLERPASLNYALRQLELDTDLGAASRVAKAVNLSQRRFIETFRSRVGLAPKLYSRIQRFQRILDRVAAAEHVDWLKTALECGYYDQPHFNHDFRAFTGLRPTEYWNLRIAGQTNHVRVDG